MAAPDTEPVPLRLPAILQNPVNRTQKQVEAHNAQQREKVEAKRERIREARAGDGGAGGKGDRRGKRVIRRVDNAAFTSNPHIVRPSRSDYAPPYPLMSHPPLPLKTLPRSSTIPPVDVPAKDPLSPSSVNGTFSTSIKGIRQVLRKKGRRTEVVVQRVEEEVRGWLAGKGVLEHEQGQDEGWKIIDNTLLESRIEPEQQQDGGSSAATTTPTPTASRRIPARHRPGSTLPSLPIQEDGQLSAILELSRSAGHLSWAAMEGFERLVIHLIARYYELVSWSKLVIYLTLGLGLDLDLGKRKGEEGQQLTHPTGEDHSTTSGGRVRLTHIIQPNIVNPRAPLPNGGALVTPDNSDLSAPSSSDLSSSAGSSTETDSDTGTEVGLTDDDEEDGAEGYSLVPPPSDLNAQSGRLPSAMEDLSLHRTYSSSSSQYAESEGGSDFGVGMADSLTLPPMPHTQAQGQGDWLRTFENGPIDLGAPPGAGAGAAGVGVSPGRRVAVQPPAVGGAARRGWQDKPTFFEYLYGA